MESRAAIPSLRFASCCIVLVVNGGEGRRVCVFCSTLVTVHELAEIFACSSFAAASSSNSTVEPSFSCPVFSSKSFPVAMRLPPIVCRTASNFPSPAASRAALRSQNVPLRNLSRSISRSTSTRTATLCTRPAESLGAIFFHSNGLSVYP